MARRDRPSPRRPNPPRPRRRRDRPAGGHGPGPGGEDPWSLTSLVSGLGERIEAYAEAHRDEPPEQWLYREIDAWAAARDAAWKRRSAERDPLAIVPEPACRPGCVHCCYQHVAVTGAEVHLLAGHIRRHWEPAEVEELRRRLDAGAEAARRIIDRAATPEAARRALAEVRRPCPLLDERLGRCRAYEARPVNCRRENSVDAEVCRRYRHKEDPDSSDSSLRLVRYDVIWGATQALLFRWGADQLDQDLGEVVPLDLALGPALAPAGPTALRDDGAADHAVEP